MNRRKRMAWVTWVTWLVGGGLLLVLATLAAGQLGAFSGAPPADLGVHDGRLKAPSLTANSVSSQAALHAGHPQQKAAMVAPLPLRGTPTEALQRLRTVALALPGARLVTQRDDYLHLQFSTRWLGFVDDAEFWADPAQQAIQVRSASRLGRKDFEVNRARVEQLRSALAAAG